MAASLTFPVSYGPDWSAVRKPKLAVLATTFGDGYSARSRDGLNSVRSIWDVKWTSLSPSDAVTADNFLCSRAGVEPFLWTAPGYTSPQQWMCDIWTRSIEDAVASSISCTFTEVFDL